VLYFLLMISEVMG